MKMYENNGWMMEEIARTKREGWLHDAELYRLERIALAARPSRPGLGTKILYQVGRLMADWGSRLVERYRWAGELRAAAAGTSR
jgi:hypothetical protein